MMAFARTLAVALLSMAVLVAQPARAADPQEVMHQWYRLALELVRHTPTYSPPVASRAFGYIGVTAWESVAALDPSLTSLAGQLNDLSAMPERPEGQLDPAVVMNAALTTTISHMFSNTGPTGQRALGAMVRIQGKTVLDGVAPDIAERSEAFGVQIAQHILDWSEGDGGAVIENLGFPDQYTPNEGPEHWVPTSTIRLQQAPLLPNWGKNRPFAMPSGKSCQIAPPPAYSEDPSSEFYAEAKEVLDVSKSLTDEQKVIARFWSDDPMLSPTPPGHWIFFTLDILERENADVVESADVLARLGVGMADAFIGCWDAKMEYDLVRPVTYIQRVMDPNFEPILITPPFPEYPSGHSTQSGAAAAVLTAYWGDNFAFSDATHVDDGIPARDFPSFFAAAEEAALSRLYGGIHFRAAIERGLDQGKCIATYTTALKTKAK